jgi:hypothetical protein
MPILNYTTNVPAAKTVGEIVTMLAKAGAEEILSEYHKGTTRPKGIRFKLDTSEHGGQIYRLPVNPEGVFQAMVENSKIPRSLKNQEQAERVAWRIAKDWIESQLALVEAGNARMAEAFMPYMLVGGGGRTLYEMLPRPALTGPELGRLLPGPDGLNTGVPKDRP